MAPTPKGKREGEKTTFFTDSTCITLRTRTDRQMTSRSGCSVLGDLIPPTPPLIQTPLGMLWGGLSPQTTSVAKSFSAAPAFRWAQPPFK